MQLVNIHLMFFSPGTDPSQPTRIPVAPRFSAQIARTDLPEATRLEILATALLLSCQAGVTEDAQYATTPLGKPVLTGAGQEAVSEISISHTSYIDSGAAVLAMDTQALGIDIEAANRAYEPQVARKVLAEATCNQLENQDIPADQRQRLFVQEWTCTEAALKAEGTGFVTAEPPHVVRARWQTQSLDVAGFTVSLATAEPARPVLHIHHLADYLSGGQDGKPLHTTGERERHGQPHL